jgi:hypothetical protein
MATTNPSLFGMLGDEAAMQRQLDEQRAQAFAQQTQEQRLASMGYSAGAGLGRGIAGAFGVDVTDPVVRQATQLRQLASEFDTTTPEGMMKFAQAARSISPDVAQKAAQEAQAMQLKSAEITAKTAEKMTNEQRNALALVASAGLDVRTPEGAKAYNEALKGLTSKTGSKSDLAKLLEERSTLDPNDKQTIALYDAKIKKLTAPGGIGSEIAAGLSPVVNALVEGQVKEAAKQAGKDVGAIPAAIEGKYEAGYAITDALDLLDKGIYAGGYAPLEETIAKYGMGLVGNKKRLANTQEFKAYLAEVVIPRLKDFGGSDTVEELKYIQQAAGSNTDVEPQALKGILQRADKKIKRGIERAQRQYKELQKGQPISVGPAEGGKSKTSYTTKSGVTYTKEED